MNIRDLQYLVATADEKHFGRAAKRCFVSQPTLSAQLKKLEDELNLQIFERNNRQVLITPEGELIVKQARDILGAIEQLKATANASNNPYSGRINIGIIPTLAPYLLPHIIPSIKQALPDLALYLTEEQTDVILSKLANGTLDAVILALPVNNHSFVTEHLFDEKFFVALPNNHRLAQAESISLAQLKKESLLLLEDGHCLRDQALDVCKHTEIQEKPGFRATSLETLRHMVSIGLGITLLPELSINPATMNTDLLCVKPLSNPQPYRPIAMLWRNYTAKTTCCQKLVAIIRQQIQTVL